MRVDLAVIGAGPGGYVAAIRAAQLGKSVALLEERDAGGTCLNRGCIPTKSLLHSAGLYREVCGAASFGVHADGVRFDLGEMAARKDEVVTKLRAGVEGLVAQNGVKLVREHGVIEGPGRVRAGDETIEAEHILIATGSTPSLPPIPGIEHCGTSDGLLENTAPIGRLVIIGGGVIGVEFASVYSALGAQVTIIEALDRVLPTFDREISQNLAMILKKRGVKIVCGARVTQVEDAPLACRYACKGKEELAQADYILCAVGRRPNTQGLFADGFGVETDRGRIAVDGQFATSVPGVYAIGDVSGKIQLAHVASAQGIAAVEAMFGAQRSVSFAAVPSCVYSDPEIACVGVTADEAKASGVAASAGKFLMTGFGKTLIEGSERSFLKLVFEEGSERLLGAQLMCPRATDMIGELCSAVAHGLTRGQLAGVIRPHPTFCEAVTEAAEAAAGHSIHSAPKKK